VYWGFLVVDDMSWGRDGFDTVSGERVGGASEARRWKVDKMGSGKGRRGLSRRLVSRLVGRDAGHSPFAHRGRALQRRSGAFKDESQEDYLVMNKPGSTDEVVNDQCSCSSHKGWALRGRTSINSAKPTSVFDTVKGGLMRHIFPRGIVRSAPRTIPVPHHRPLRSQHCTST
jgi:hypothetical protein